MGIKTWSGRSLLLRFGGGVLLFAAWRIADDAVWFGHGLAGHEPPKVYALCLLAFLCGSAGAALLANGIRLFGKVPMGELWTPHPDDAMSQTEPLSRRNHRA